MRDRTRVLLVLAESTGGIGRHVATLARGLPGYGADVTVCGPADTLAGLGDLGQARQAPAPIGSRAARGLLAARRELRALAADVDIVHAHGLRAGAAAAAAGSHPLVVTWHNARLLGGARGMLQAALARYVARRTDLTLGASEDLVADARRAGADQARSTFVVAPGLPQARRHPESVRAELGAGDRPLVLAVGRLQAQKRLDVLIEAAAEWAGQPGAPVVVVAGDGPDQPALAARIAATGAPVTLLGARDDVADLLAAADVVALPSSWEARSLVAQEALRAGVPLVTTAVGGLQELVGPAAVLVPVGDAAALRSGIEQVLADPRLRARLIADGRARAASWPDTDTALDQLVRAYRHLMLNLRLTD